MSLRRQMPWLLGLTIIIIITGVGAFSYSAYRDRLASLEEERVQQSIDRALRVFHGYLAGLSQQAAQCGQEEAFLACVRSGRWEEGTAFFNTAFFQAGGADTAVFFNAAGEPVLVQRYDWQQREVEVPSPALVAQLARIYESLAAETEAAGLIQMTEGVMLAASRSLPSNRTGENGILMLGRFLDAAVIEHLAAAAQINLSLRRYLPPSAAPDRNVLFPGISDLSPIAVERISDETIAGGTVLNDITGRPALILTAYLPRYLYWQGREGLRFFVVLFLLSGALCGAGAILILDRMVLRRLADLSRSVREVAAGGDLSRRMLATGKDELADLESGISGMLEALARTEALREREEKYAAVFNNANDAMLLYRLTEDNRASVLSEVNDVACRMLGYRRDELLAMDLAACVAPEYSVAFQTAQERLWLLGQVRFEVELAGSGGKRIPAEINAHVFPLGTQRYALTIIRDISGRREAERKLQYRLTVEKALSQAAGMLVQGDTTDLTAVVAVLGQAVGVSRAYIFQLSSDGKTIAKTAEWCDNGVPSYRQETSSVSISGLNWALARLKRREAVSIPDVLQLPPEAASERNLYSGLGARAILTVPIFADGKFAGILGFAVTAVPRRWAEEDIELLKTVSGIIGSYLERKTTEDKVRYLSFLDKLTGLYNKAYFEEELVRLDTERQLPLSLIMGDMNGLKIINDAFGHTAGDALLHSAARVLKQVCRKEDIIARWGGDEFVILLPQTNAGAAREIIRRIRSVLRTATCEHVPLSMAFGTAIKETPETDIRQVFRLAEDRMYHNKLQEGKQTRAAIITAFGQALIAKGFQTEGHVRRTGRLAAALGRAAGITPEEMAQLKLLAALHDIGKISLPDEILHKKGPLTAMEWAEIRKYPEVGFRIANSIPELAPVAEAILAHQERWDGNGYPVGVAGPEIPLVARIIGIVDAYDTMVSDQPYRAAMGAVAALAEIEAGAGRQFDPALVQLFIRLINAGAADALVGVAVTEEKETAGE
ncbi:MAG: HD domain-containing phosphohydrolase [bacterium]